MKNKIILMGLSIVMFCLLSVFGVAAVCDTLEVGQSKQYLLDGTPYDITFMVAAGNASDNAAVKFIVNDEVTDTLNVGNKFGLKDNTILSFRDFVITHSGNTSFTLAEFCISHSCSSSEPCAQGYTCSSWACTPKTTCSESDGGFDSFVKGTTSAVSSDYSSTWDDQCVYIKNNAIYSTQSCDGSYPGCYLQEIGCKEYSDPSVVSNTKFQLFDAYIQNVNCKYGCENGACRKAPITNCNGADTSDTLEAGQTKMYTINGLNYEVTVMVVAAGSSTSSTSTKMIINDEVTDTLHAGDSFTLKDGSIIKIREIIPTKSDSAALSIVEFCFFANKNVRCSETDGGDKIFAKGTTSGMEIGTKKSISQTDYCIEQNKLVEYFCNDVYPNYEPGYVNNAIKDCPYGCRNGACIQGHSCSDSDGGINYDVKGKYDAPGYGTGWDSCFGPESWNLLEHYCENGMHQQVEYRCPNGCKDGACIPSETKHLLLVYDTAPATDVVLISDLGTKFKYDYGDIFSTKLTGEITKADLENRITVFVYLGKAVIIVGRSSPADQVVMANKMLSYLQDERHLSVKEILSSEVYDKDLRKLFDQSCGDGICESGEQQTCAKDCGDAVINGYLGQTFTLKQGQIANIIDYDNFRFSLVDIVTQCRQYTNSESTENGMGGGGAGCVQVGAHIEIFYPGCKETGDLIQCAAGVVDKQYIKVGETKEVSGINIRLQALASDSAVFLPAKKDKDLVDIRINPVTEEVFYGENAVYKITVKDKHAVIKCHETNCLYPVYDYEITVSNLPFYKKYPQTVTLRPGEEQSFDLVVMPFVVQTATEEGEVAIAKVSNTQISDGGAATQMVTGNAILENAEKIEVATKQLQREYKFSVSAKLKEDQIVKDEEYARLVIKPKEPPVFPTEDVKISLHKGWNLISLPGKLIRFIDGGCGKDKKLLGFVYLKESQQYVTLKEAERILGKDFNEYLAKNAFWVYSYADCALTVKVDPAVSYSGLNLYQGWNLVPVTEDMIGGYLRDILDDCMIQKLSKWDAKKQQWQSISLDYVFTDSDNGYGFIAKADNYCSLGGVSILAPPPMP